ncbi:MAG: LOG family protein [Candidatus Dadabacteria bacterium]|nr:MAG: LOG family protein [Candidatus Dadabacteria bacterium]
MDTPAPIVAVYGSSAAEPATPVYRSALVLGRLLAKRGAVVACGGYGGVMEAVSRGARQAGGRVIGYTVAAWTERRPNQYLSEEHRCADLYERLRCLIDGSRAMVALGGGIGTLVEVLLAWNLLFTGMLPPRPLIVVGREWARTLAALSDFLEVGPHHLRYLCQCDHVEEAVERLQREGVLP